MTTQFYALIDRLRSIDKRRIRRVHGELSRDQLRRIDDGSIALLGLVAEP